MTSAEVVDLIASRRGRGRGTGAGHDDGAVLALVIEGGGMRGIVSAAMTCAIEDSGLLNAVDLVVGTSSGGVNAAAAAGGVISLFADSYADVFSAREFIDLRRILIGRAVINAPHIVEHLERLFGLSGFTARREGPQLAVVATDVDTAEASALSEFTSREDMLGAIQASGTLPLLAGPPVHLRGRRWLDGGIVEPLPVRSAGRLGATHAIVLATRPLGSDPPFDPMDWIIHRYLGGLNPALAVAYRRRRVLYQETLMQAKTGAVDGVDTLLLTPRSDSALPARLERNPDRIRAVRHVSQVEALRQLAQLGLRG